MENQSSILYPPSSILYFYKESSYAFCDSTPDCLTLADFSDANQCSNLDDIGLRAVGVCEARLPFA
jgi:hypothetical protein